MVSDLDRILGIAVIAASIGLPIAGAIWWMFIGQWRARWREDWYKSNRDRGWEGGPFRRGEYPWSRGHIDGIPFEIQVRPAQSGKVFYSTETLFRATAMKLVGPGFTIVPRTLNNRLVYTRQLRTGDKRVDDRFIISSGADPEFSLAVFRDPQLLASLRAIEFEYGVDRARDPFRFEGTTVTRCMNGACKDATERLELTQAVVRLAAAIATAVFNDGAYFKRVEAGAAPTDTTNQS